MKQAAPAERVTSGHVEPVFGSMAAHPLQRQVDASPRQSAQQGKLAQMQAGSSGRAAPNGLPPQLRAGIESLSGMDMADVVVHRHSGKPAQLSAHAYAQGNEIHLGPSQEHHLPHEAWHVVQQKQGRVKARGTVAGAYVNDDPGLESEADTMGRKALQLMPATRQRAADEGSHTSPAVSVGQRNSVQRQPVQRVSSMPIQLGKNGENGDDGVPDDQAGRQLALRGNVQTNLALLQNVWRFLPAAVQVFLEGIRRDLAGEKTQDGSTPSDGSGVVAVRDRSHDTPLMRILNLDPRIIRNVVVGLYVMPKTQQKTLRTMDAVSLMGLFNSLATAKHSPLLALTAPPEGVRTGTTGAEHIQNSCYAASILNIISRNAYYRLMCDPMQNPTPPDSQARRLQDAILPLVMRIQHGGTVAAAQMTQLIQCLNRANLLLAEAGDPEREQQDASHVLMGVLNLLRPASPLTTRETRVYDDRSPTRVQNESEFVLQLYARGHRTFLEALRAHFVNDVHSSVLHDEEVDDPHRVTRVITGFPELLTIGMARVDGDDAINMPRQFTIPAQVTQNGLPGPTYQLTAYIVRTTISQLSGGHYVAVIGNEDGSWDEMDDMGDPKEGERGVWTPSNSRVNPSVHRVGEHHAPSYAVANLYTYRRLQGHEVESGGATIEFPGGLILRHPQLSDTLMASGLPGGEMNERVRLIDEFLSSGGSIWDADRLLQAEPVDNEKLRARFIELQRSRQVYSEEDRKDPIVQGLLQGFASLSVSEILKMQAQTEEHKKTSKGDHAEFLRKQSVALNLTLGAKQSKAREGYEKFFEASNDTGMKVEIYGTDRVLLDPRVTNWAQGIALTLVKAPFLASRKPALQIRIRLRPQTTKDIASTHGNGNLITVNMDDYQATRFTIGESLGLLAHELGVHSLDATSLNEKELEDEELNKGKPKKGKIGGTEYTVGDDPKAEGQQDDHLTIGRAILGELSGLPRLHMYENTMLSILRAAATAEARREIAAAYCVDIARIVVLNDESGKVNKAGVLAKISIGNQIAGVATAEWTRIQRNYGKSFPEIMKIKLGTFDILGYLFRLKSILEKIAKEANKP